MDANDPKSPKGLWTPLFHSSKKQKRTRNPSTSTSGRMMFTLHYWPPVDQWRDGSKSQLFLSVLEEMDRQLGKLFDHIHNDPDLTDNTIILACSDNGPEKGAGVAGSFRGYKTHLFEGESVHLLWLGHPS